MKWAGLLLVGACLLFSRAAAQSQNDNEPLDVKSYGCAQHLDLVDLEDGRAEIVTVWAHGYYHGMRGMNESSTTGMWLSVEAFSEQLIKTCKHDPEKLFIDAVRQIARVKPDPKQ